MDLFNSILFWVDIGVIAVVLSVFLFQLIFGLLFFLPHRKYPKAKKIHDFTFIIRARNEEDVIGDCIDSCLKADYPADKKHVIVFCHNCTDHTAEIAVKHGARAVILTDHEPTHQKASYCMKLGMDELKKDPEGTYEYFLFIDADNQVDKNYLHAVNDAADDGVDLGRTYENSKNLTDNLLSCMTGLWYARDDRFACSTRSALRLGCVMNGCCSMVKAEYGLNWDAMSTSDDIEFTLNRLLKDKKKVEYISEAILYEDQPTTMKDVFKRNTRMGNGLNKLYWTTGLKVYGEFWKSLFNPHVKWSMKMAYLDQYTNIAAIPTAFLCFVWFPLYFLYTFLWIGFKGPLMVAGIPFAITWQGLLITVVIAASICYLIPFWVQPLLSFLTERKKFIITKKSVMFWSLLLFPTFEIINGFAIIEGIFKKPKWAKLKRSTTKIKQ
ncbi:MAG: glycosyltransferase family 2 protein [Bacilli bacterium]